MTQQTLAYQDRYLVAFEAFERNGARSDPSWVQDLRRDAIARFREIGLPTARRGNEEWKYTDVRPIAQSPFQLPDPAAPARATAAQVERFTYGEPGWNRLVFVDGVFAERLSSLPALPAGVRVMDLAQAVVAHGDLAGRHLARHAEYAEKGFTALNTAFLHSGAFVYVPDNVVVETPIHLLWLSTAGEPETVSHPRTLVVTGRGSRATVIETYGSMGDGRHFANAVTEVVVGANAKVEYYKAQRENEQSFHVATTWAELDRDSRFESINIDLGGGLTRNNLRVHVAGQGASAMLNGVYVVTREQHVDNEVIIDHAAPHTSALEYYKGILDGQSQSVFHGSIIVRENCPQVNAHQQDKNLLLSNECEADTKPAFWIYTDDVKCGHGAACGKIDENALFYLRSRGIPEDEARRLLIRGFVTEIIDTIPHKAFRGRVEALVEERLRDLRR